VTGINRADLQDSVDYLLQIASATVETHPNRAFDNAAVAKQISVQYKWNYRALRAYKYMGEAKLELEDYYQAEKYLLDAVQLLPEDAPNLSGSLYFSLGKANYYLGDYEQASMSYREALKYFESVNNVYNIAKVLQNIGLVHHNLDDLAKASYYYQKALEINTGLKNDTNIAGLYQNLGIIYYKNDDFERALDYYNRSVKIFTELSDTQNIATTYSNIGLIHLQQADYEKAFNSFKESYELFSKIGYKLGIMWTLHNMGTAKLSVEDFKQARKYYDNSLGEARKLNNPEGILSNLSALTELSELTNDFQNAYYYYMSYTDIQDSIHASELKAKIAELETLYNIETQEKKIAESNIEIKRQKTQKTAILIILGILFIASVIIYIAYHQKRKAQIKIVSHKLDLENTLIEKSRELETQISERKIAEESDKLKSAFLANMSHELRTPMNAIIAFSNFLRDPELSTTKREEYLDHITAAGDSLLRLIDDIIDIAKLESKQLNISIGPVNITRLLKEIYKLFVNLKSKQNYRAELNLNIDRKIDIIVNTDAIRIKQIISNLLENAFKYTPKGVIDFGVIEKEGWLEFYIRDTGIGIPEEKLEKIFERFSQVETELNRKYGGTGLGLAISKNLSELLGGSIHVESTPRKGSTFYVTIPALDLRKVEVVPEITRATNIINENNYNWESKTILVAEDEEINFKVLDSCLSKTNARILRASDGAMAVEMCLQEKVDLVLMDIQMPNMDGYEATLAIKKINKDVPVIAQTSFAMTNEKDRCLHAGCDDYITLPLDLDNLLAKISHYIH
jgi:signal transduction histidine kinase/CheY-like chemotaxis protein/Flp pilus assembly protein TadD